MLHYMDIFYMNSNKYRSSLFSISAGLFYLILKKPYLGNILKENKNCDSIRIILTLNIELKIMTKIPPPVEPLYGLTIDINISW